MTKMNFEKFTSIKSAYKEKEVNRIKNEHPEYADSPEWYVLEKLDGANFAFYIGHKGVRVASRNGFTDENFMKSGAGTVLERYAAHLHMLPFACGLDFSDGSYLVVRGELFGKGILNRVNYGDDIDFNAFGLEAHFPKEDNKIVTYSFSDLENILMTTGMMMAKGSSQDTITTVPILKEGVTLDEALRTEVEEVQSFFTPEDYDEFNNIEGVVIMPDDALFLRTGSRVMLKKVANKFSEKKGASGKKNKMTEPLSQHDQERLDTLLNYVNESRVLSAVSKLGIDDQKSFGAIMSEVVQDILEEFEDDFEYEGFSGLDEAQRVKQLLGRAVSAEVKPIFLRELEGEE